MLNNDILQAHGRRYRSLKMGGGGLSFLLLP